MEAGRDGEAEQAIGRAIERLPDDSASATRHIRTVYAKAHGAAGTLAYRGGRYAEAEALFRKAVSVARDDVRSRTNLGRALSRQGRLDEAIREWSDVVRDFPRDARAHGALAWGYAGTGRHAASARHYRAALVLQPGLSTARLELAWLLASTPDERVRNGGDAVRLAEVVRDGQDGDSVAVLDALGAAHAAVGEFGHAVRYAQAAVALGERQGMGGLDPVRRRLGLYRDGVAYIVGSERAD